MIRIVWDERKREANIAKHGLDFEALDEEFFRGARIADAKRKRFQALGRYHEGIIIVIFARLGTEAFSIISMRPASARERASCDKAYFL